MLSLVVLIVIFSAAVFCFFIRANNYRSLIDMVPDYVTAFEQLHYTTPENYWNTAVDITESFENTDRVKVTVFNSSGIVISSTDGFIETEVVESMPDYNAALVSGEGYSTWNGRDPATGENIAATTVVVKNEAGAVLGAYRYVISLQAFNKMMLGYYVLVGSVGLVMIGVLALSGVYFVLSIVRPVRQVTAVTRKIARGDLNNRLEHRNDDEIGELCDAINYMALELGKTDKLKNDFISSVSHELRTPLTAIKGWGETVSMAVGSDDETVKRGIDVILNETDRLSGLVEELLDFSRLQSGKFRFDMRLIDMVPVLSEAVNMYDEIVKKQGITMTYLPFAGEVTVNGDRNRLKQVFINIIDNAVKYTNSGGQIIISSALEEGCIRLLVQDTGIGIPKQDLDHVKERFYKANKTVRGSGIGLAVADEIINQHNGLLIVESTENVGTSVSVVLPIAQRDAASEQQGKDEAVQNEEGK